MSNWARTHPELVGREGFDPWMDNAHYRKAIMQTELECPECGDWARLTAEGLCRRCDLGA